MVDDTGPVASTTSKASAETLLTIAANPKHLGARIGFTAVLHTWGSAMPHPARLAVRRRLGGPGGFGGWFASTGWGRGGRG